MSDLLAVSPDFQPGPFSNVLPSLERTGIRVSDLLTLDAADVARQAQVPAREVRRLCDAILDALHAHLRSPGSTDPDRDTADFGGNPPRSTRSNLLDLDGRWSTIGCLDDRLDRALSGGIPTGYLTEVTGESGAGKTHFLLTLLLAVQLPPPRGLGRGAIYISTEAPLATSRLGQLLASHPLLSSLDETSHKPSLSRVLSISTPDLEAQEHILRYQLPVAVRRHNVGLVVIDSVTANFRAEFEQRSESAGHERGPGALAKRSAQLIELGALLRNLARTHDVAVVVANQVADRFSPTHVTLDAGAVNSSQPSSVAPTSSPAEAEVDPHDPMTLDHQQRWFTGWGDEPAHRFGTTGMKTPSLGLVWTNQIACRIALTRRMARGTGIEGGNMHWKRHLRVVFSPWAKDNAGSPGTEFAITKEGMVGIADAQVGHAE